MKALVPTGRPEALVELAGVGIPDPAPGEALVKVEAFSVNRGEIFQLEDPFPGARPGKGLAGAVVQPAADGTGPAAGQRVADHPEQGGWTEYAAVPAASLAPLPDTVPVTQAAALPLAGLTALRLLRTAGHIIGRRILLTGASGGVGHYVTELAASRMQVTPSSVLSATRMPGRAPCRTAAAAQARRRAAFTAAVILPSARSPPWAISSSVRHAVGTEATSPNRSSWSPITRKSLIASAPSAIAQAKSASTRPGHGPAASARPAPSTGPQSGPCCPPASGSAPPRHATRSPCRPR